MKNIKFVIRPRHYKDSFVIAYTKYKFETTNEEKKLLEKCFVDAFEATCTNPLLFLRLEEDGYLARNVGIAKLLFNKEADDNE